MYLTSGSHNPRFRSRLRSKKISYILIKLLNSYFTDIANPANPVTSQFLLAFWTVNKIGYLGFAAALLALVTYYLAQLGAYDPHRLKSF